MTPLSAAATQEAFETMCSLLQQWADPNVTGRSGDTPLHMICLSPKVGFEEAVDELCFCRGGPKYPRLGSVYSSGQPRHPSGFFRHVRRRRIRASRRGSAGTEELEMYGLD